MVLSVSQLEWIEQCLYLGKFRLCFVCSCVCDNAFLFDEDLAVGDVWVAQKEVLIWFTWLKEIIFCINVDQATFFAVYLPT